MKHKLVAIIIIFFGLSISITAYSVQLYKCADHDNNVIITDSPQGGMKDCVLKDSSDNPSPTENKNTQSKSYNSMKAYSRESDKSNAAKDAERAAKEQDEATLIREGNKCYTQGLNVISGGYVSGVYYWRICKDKNGKVVSKRRL